MSIIIKRLFVIILLFAGATNIAQGQAFNFQAIDGGNQQIHVILNGETLTIACLKDTLFIKDVNEVKTTNVINKNFLVEIYSIRAGSGLNVQHTLILAVKNKVLRQALHFTSFFHEDFIDFRKNPPTPNKPDIISNYETGLNLTGSTATDYRLGIKIHDERKAKDNPQTNYHKSNEVTLSFDTSRAIFYSKHEYIARYFSIFDPKTDNENKQYIRGAFPMIKLGSYRYYYIKGEWYEKNEYGDMSKYAYK